MNTKAVFIWDDEYFKKRNYSLKRLVFIYETLCEMPLEIIHGNTLDVIDMLSPEKINMFSTADTEIQKIISEISCRHNIEVIDQPSFAKISNGFQFTRFFKYWNKAKKTAFTKSEITQEDELM